MIATGIPTLPPIFRRIVRAFPATKNSSEIQSSLQGLTFRVILYGWVACTLGWILMGLSLCAVVEAIPSSHSMPGWIEAAPIMVASVSLAVVTGFLSLIPGGLFVREYVLDQLLNKDFGSVVAIVAAVLLRVVWIVTELAVSGILYIAASRTGGRQKKDGP